MTSSLGPLIREHRGKQGVGAYGLAAFFLFLGVLLSLRIDEDGWMVWLVFGPFTVLFVWLGHVISSQRLRIHQEGVEWARGRKSKTLRWADATHRLELHHHSGAAGLLLPPMQMHMLEAGADKLVIGKAGYEDVDAVLADVEQMLAERRAPLDKARLENGEDVGFGALVVTPAGIRRGELLLPFERVLGVSREPGDGDGPRLQIRSRGGSAPVSVPVKDVPNAEVFVALVKDRCQAR